jgi:DNA-binding transcriptional MerR regulator
MAMIRTNAAASMLGVSSNTLRSWERRYGFPHPRRSEGGHRQYELGEIEALRQTLAETHNISSAIALVQERGPGPASSTRLATAYGHYDEFEANRLLEESLTLRSLERTVEEVLLPGVAERADLGGLTADYEFAWRHATDWLAAFSRLAPPPTRPETVLLFDATVPCDLDALHGRALTLLLRRQGIRTLSLTPAIERSRLGRALRALDPDAVVLCGRRSSLDTVGRLVYTVRSMRSGALVFDYRGAVAETRGSVISRLGDSPLQARDGLLTALDGSRASVASLQ